MCIVVAVALLEFMSLNNLHCKLHNVIRLLMYVVCKLLDIILAHDYASADRNILLYDLKCRAYKYMGRRKKSLQKY